MKSSFKKNSPAEGETHVAANKARDENFMVVSESSRSSSTKRAYGVHTGVGGGLKMTGCDFRREEARRSGEGQARSSKDF